jgi:hypothetical protein
MTTSDARAPSTARSEPRDPVPRRWRVLTFRVVAALVGLFFALAVVFNGAGPWVVLSQSGDPQIGAHRWFLAVSAGADLILAGCLLALAYRPRFTLLVVYPAVAVVIAGAIILPFDLTFVVYLLVVVLALALYPYWGDVRAFPRWWTGANRPLLALASVVGGVLVVTAITALTRQIGGTDSAAAVDWWPDYAEHATLLGVAGILAACCGPGWRVLGTLCGVAWLYLGLVAALVLPGATGSWGRLAGVAAVLVGLAFAAAVWRGAPRRAPAAVRPAHR